jgi:hypothetical protein
MAVSLIRTASLVLVLALGLSAASAQTFTGSYLIHDGTVATKPFGPESGSVTDVPSISLDRHVELSAPAVGSQTHPLVSFTGDVSIHGADRSFGIGVDAAVDVPADAAGITNASGDSLFAGVTLDDTWFADTQSGAKTLKFTGAWNVNGNLTATASGEAPPGPFQSPYINAVAGSSIGFFADGDVPNSVAITGGGNSVRAFTNETYNNTFTNQSLPNPLITQSTFTFPSQILITFLIPNNGSLGVDFEADAEVAVRVDNEDSANAGIAIATASFGHTFTWGGITSVVDADTGQPITDWTLTSASGVDWAHAAAGPSTVPEPSTLSLAALGGLGLFVYRRRGRTEHKGSEEGYRGNL